MATWMNVYTGAAAAAAAAMKNVEARDLARQLDQLLRERAQNGWQAGRLRASVHGAWHGSTAAAVRGRIRSTTWRSMERWRENNQPPPSIEAFFFHVTNNRVDMTRPLCAYPQVAIYKGTGSPNNAANFTCK